MHDAEIANLKYLVYSLDNHISGDVMRPELPEVQTLADILMWLSDDINLTKETMSIVKGLQPGETHVFVEGQHGNFESMEIHFIKLKD